MNYPYTDFDCDIFFNPTKKNTESLNHSNSISHQSSTLFAQLQSKESVDIEYDRENTLLEKQNLRIPASLDKMSKKVFLDPGLNPKSVLVFSSEGNSSPQNLIETTSNHSGSNSSKSSNFDSKFYIYLFF